MANPMELLGEIRDFSGERQTQGLDEETVQKFLKTDPHLSDAIKLGHKEHHRLREVYTNELKQDEKSLISHLQAGYVNFYAPNAINPYVALAAKGPWVITSHGAVIHDSGGYGMLGFGHDPDPIRAAMDKPHVMANVMTASFSQADLVTRLRQEIGQNRVNGCPFGKFLCLNSGSESVTLASRFSDLNAKLQTDKGARHEGKKIMFLGHQGGFHGRTDRPAQASDSTMKAYQNLASFRDRSNLIRVRPNDKEAFANVFENADKDGVFIEMVLLEPVMGEGDPGKPITADFYELARRLTKAHGSLLLIDSIQAGLRTRGVLSIVDYPGFESLEAPDMETYSKAINAGQYPFSILAVREQVAALYKTGVYGNTMTTNPRALDVACAVLSMVDGAVRKNIKDRGKEFLDKFSELQREFPEAVTGVQGTGLLCALFLNKDGYEVMGTSGVELYLRKHGIGVIHGGENALRFTPHFRITSGEIDLIINELRRAFARGAVYK